MPCPTARAVVETSHHHGAEDARNVLALDHLLAGSGVDPVVRQRRAHPGELGGIHAYRALFGVDVDRLERIRVYAIVLGQQIREWPAIAGGKSRDRLVELESSGGMSPPPDKRSIHPSKRENASSSCTEQWVGPEMA